MKLVLVFAVSVFAASLAVAASAASLAIAIDVSNKSKCSNAAVWPERRAQSAGFKPISF